MTKLTVINWYNQTAHVCMDLVECNKTRVSEDNKMIIVVENGNSNSVADGYRKAKYNDIEINQIAVIVDLGCSNAIIKCEEYADIAVATVNGYSNTAATGSIDWDCDCHR